MARIALLESRGLDRELVQNLLLEVMGSSAGVNGIRRVSGGPNGRTLHVSLEGGGEVVLRLRRLGKYDSFELEAHQLQYLSDRAPFRVPKPLGRGVWDGLSYMVLEKLPGVELERVPGLLFPRERRDLQHSLGRRLARLHRDSRGDRFGEVSPRRSLSFPSWPDFFRSLWRDRIGAILRSDRLPPPVLDAVEWIHSSLHVLLAAPGPPCLVHGNLDGRRILCDLTSRDQLGWGVSGMIDPTLAYGHPELDLALLEMHQAVDADFFVGYRVEHEIDPGYSHRREIFFLYSTLDNVRRHGRVHDVLSAMEWVEKILRRAEA